MFELAEMRYILQAAGARSANFTVADNAAWAAGTAICPRVFDCDVSGLVEEIVEDNTLQTAWEGNPPPIEVRRVGSFKFKQWLEGGSATTTETTLMALLGSGACFGGLRDPAAISDAAEADSTTTTIKATAHAMIANEMVLVGVRGDGGGDGRVGVVNDASNANEYTLQMALPAAPAALAVLKNGHTIYMDHSVEQYIDVLFIGSHPGSGATDNPDQIQAIGCAASSIVFGGLAKGEKPFVEFTFMVSEWQWVNYADQATISHTTARAGADPVTNSAGGSLLIQDDGTTTRNAVACDELSIEWPFNLVPVTDYNYSSCVGGFVKQPPAAGTGPTIKAKAYWAKLADMPGLYDDSTGTKQAKQVLVQLGRVASGVVAWYMQKCYIRPVDPARRQNLDGNTSLELEFRATTGGATAMSTAALKLQDAAIVMWAG